MTSNIALRSHLDALQRVRAITLRTIGPDLQTEHLFHQIGGQGSHIFWLAAHLANSMDRLVNRFVFGSPLLDDRWQSAYGGGSKPTHTPAENIPWTEVIEALATVHNTVAERLGAADDSLLEKALPADSPIISRFQTYGQLIAFVAPHEAYHAGQISILRRVQGLPAQAPV